MSIFSGPIGQANAQKDAAEQLESLLTQKLLESSGAFKGTGEAGSSMSSGLFAGVLADAVAQSGGLGLARQLQTQLPQALSHESVKDVTHFLIAHPAAAEEQGGQS
jgi:Rod binding domain-containing protein